MVFRLWRKTSRSALSRTKQKPHMTTLTFSDYAAALREFIRSHSPDTTRLTQEGARTAVSARRSAIISWNERTGCPRSFPALLESAVPDTIAGDELSLAKTEPAFNELALRLFALQFAFNLPYRRFCEARGVSPATASHWRQIPAIPTSAFKELELTSLAPAERTGVFHSSGTSEQRPSRHFHNAESLAVYEASLLPWVKASLFAVGQDVRPPSPMTMTFLTPPVALAARSSLVHMFEVVRREFGASDSIFAGGVDASGAWVLEVKQVQVELANAARANRPLALLGTAFNFVHLLDYLAERHARFQLAPGSRVLETGGYKGRSRVVPKQELYSLITEYLGIPLENIVCEYGMSELSSQAYGLGGQGQERVFRFPPWARVQIISPETGREVGESETGLIRVLDLANVRSVMAIQTEDLGIRRGAGFELVGRTSLAEPRGCSLMAG